MRAMALPPPPPHPTTLMYACPNLGPGSSCRGVGVGGTTTSATGKGAGSGEGGTSGATLLGGTFSSMAAFTVGCCLLSPCTRLHSMDMLRFMKVGSPALGASTLRDRHGF